MSELNRSIYLVSRPEGMPEKSNFKTVESPVPQPAEGEVLVQTMYLSVDPYMRGRMRDVKSYVPPFPLNEVIVGGVVGRVVESKNPNFAKGDIIAGMLGWSDYSISNGKNIKKIETGAIPVTHALGILGMPGLTAYFGLLEIGKPKEGETVVVSGAAGAVGMVVGQIAKLKGCRVVGIAGTDEKNEYLRSELGFDATVNYKTTTNMRQSLAEACPNGIDVYFDNVGGEITDAVLTLINYQARIVICGQISAYNMEKPDLRPNPFTQLLIKSAMAKGFIASDFANRNQEGLAQLTEWVTQGKLKFKENVVEGLENTVEAFLGLFRGENLGKQLVKVHD
ncbi:NADP-dependent oxidoreductase [Effusibacillus dendaii]|uniref:Putative NADP-dependent oxidoreductase YfmJ n=1 Tax=Effusibacillus dendaii TaxID=2743772 RepID=A0A7I8D5U7_9BACL|nr:NADP-dependent oxidoreductase [Effusibacillus dendaii]BCJ85465.1 putative NADP-dependent oxidoreductase YfmJ [Effusibacillus dendaii]